MSAVSYLNTCPLVWGLMWGPQAGSFDLRFELPSECANSLRIGTAELGLVPVIEVFRQNLEPVSDVCIASDGAVRSIFLLHRKPLRQIRTLALDPSSRTSVALTRILLAERYGATPRGHDAAPATVSAMLDHADAAVLIGDPALRLDPAHAPFEIMDLGAEWKSWTGLPMVYAVWAGQSGRIPHDAAKIFRESYEFGKANREQIAHQEAFPRGIAPELAREYLTHFIKYELDERARAGMREFEKLSRKHRLLDQPAI